MCVLKFQAFLCPYEHTEKSSAFFSGTVIAENLWDNIMHHGEGMGGDCALSHRVSCTS